MTDADAAHATPAAENALAFYDLLQDQLPGSAFSAVLSQVQSRRVPQSALSVDAAMRIVAAYFAGVPAQQWVDAAGLPARRVVASRPQVSDPRIASVE